MSNFRFQKGHQLITTADREARRTGRVPGVAAEPASAPAALDTTRVGERLRAATTARVDTTVQTDSTAWAVVAWDVLDPSSLPEAVRGFLSPKRSDIPEKAALRALRRTEVQTRAQVDTITLVRRNRRWRIDKSWNEPLRYAETKIDIRGVDMAVDSTDTEPLVVVAGQAKNGGDRDLLSIQLEIDLLRPDSTVERTYKHAITNQIGGVRPQEEPIHPGMVPMFQVEIPVQSATISDAEVAATRVRFEQN
jgi:hypothetical protein